MASPQELRALCLREQERAGRPDVWIGIMVERWWPVDEDDPPRLQLFRTSGPWGEVGFRWLRSVHVRFRADEVLAALDEQFPTTRINR